MRFGISIVTVLKVVTAALLTASLGLAGCGVRGGLETPGAAQGPSNTANADSGQGKKAGDAPKPHQPSILDGLLR